MTEAAYTGLNWQMVSDSGAQTDAAGWRELLRVFMQRAGNLLRDSEGQRFDSGLTAEARAERVEGEMSTTATIYNERLRSVETAAAIAFRSAQEVVFEDGVESEFERQLVRLVEEEGYPVLDPIARLIDSEHINGEVASMALRVLGEMNHPASRSRRLRLLVKSLHSSSYWVRDGATVGLAWLDDETAIPHLTKAAEREPIAALCRNMEVVIAQLQETRLCRER
jgi:HEAT repeat protein